MIQRTVKVNSAETLPTKDGKKTYLSVVLSDGNRENKYSIFDPALQKTLQDAHKSGESVNVGLEKEGNFWNVKSAGITTDEPTTEQPKQTGQRFYHDRHSQDAEDWTNIRTAVMQAVGLETHHIVPEGKVNVGRVMQNANEIFASMIMMKPKREEQ